MCLLMRENTHQGLWGSRVMGQKMASVCFSWGGWETLGNKVDRKWPFLAHSTQWPIQKLSRSFSLSFSKTIKARPTVLHLEYTNIQGFSKLVGSIFLCEKKIICKLGVRVITIACELILQGKHPNWEIWMCENSPEFWLPGWTQTAAAARTFKRSWGGIYFVANQNILQFKMLWFILSDRMQKA